MFLDPAKLLVILIVALVVLGPDKLPTVARQLGSAWNEIRKFRERLETEVRGSFPDLPSTQQVAQAVRSPLSFLDQLADAHEREQSEIDQQRQLGGITPTPPGKPPEPGASPGDDPGRGALEPVRSTPRPVVKTRPWRGSQAGEPLVVPDDPSMN